jgi:hypothetical protein
VKIMTRTIDSQVMLLAALAVIGYVMLFTL